MQSQQELIEYHKAVSLTGVYPEKLDFKEINALSMRDAMGFSVRGSNSSIAKIKPVMTQIQNLNDIELVDLLENRETDFISRHTAGLILALRGDPRIDPFNPHMINIPGTEVTCGLEPEQVDAVTSQYQSYGVLREWIEKETPSHKVTLKPYKMGKYPVTNDEYLAFLLDSHYQEIPESWGFGSFPEDKSNHPVQSLSYAAAEAYVEWLNGKTGRLFRLPTEAEWEFAASGPKGFEFPWGQHYLKDHCNTLESGILSTTPVGMFPLGQSPFGLMDMAGNVEEYVSCDYQPYENAQVAQDDLYLSSGGQYKVARGGSFTRFRDLARTRRRHGKYNSDLYVMGFRLAEG